MPSTNDATVLNRIAAIHVSQPVYSPGGGHALYCASCTRSRYPCRTLQLIDEARAAARQDGA